MTGTMKAMCQATALALLLAVATAAPAKAQFGGGGGNQDMMTQMAPMLEMMKAKMGKKRFATLMQTMGPMMSNMMEGGGGGLGGMLGGGGFGGGGFGGGGFGNLGGGYTTSSFVGDTPQYSGGFGGGGGDFMGMLGSSGMTAMIPQMMSMINTGGGRHGRRKKRG
jgi:hypothetical protein